MILRACLLLTLGLLFSSASRAADLKVLILGNTQALNAAEAAFPPSPVPTSPSPAPTFTKAKATP
jgi:hypothetical protein